VPHQWDREWGKGSRGSVFSFFSAGTHKHQMHTAQEEGRIDDNLRNSEVTREF